MADATAAISGMQDDLAGIYKPGEPMTFWRINAERNALRFRLRYLESIKANCKTCEHFGHEVGFNRCDVFDEVPPTEFQTKDGACESWLHDGVAF
jgi:hypothetical protein